MTPAEKAIAFKNENPTHIDEDGYYGAQCWDVSARYARVKYGCPSFPTGSGGAEGLWRLHQDPIPQYFDVLPASAAQAGDIGVCPASFSPPWGHTFVILARNGNTLTVFEQNGNNPGGDPYVTTRYVSQMSGVLSPKDKGAGKAMIPDNDAWFSRFDRLMVQIRGRHITRDEFRKNFVGVDPFHMVEILSDNTEADNATKAQDTGQVALRDNWPGQIYGLQDALKASNQSLSDANAALTVARQQLQDLGSRPTKEDLAAVTKQLQDAEATAMKAQADYEKAHSDLLAAQAQTAQDTATGNSFLRWLGGILGKLKK